MKALPKTMRGIWLTGHGGMDRLEMRNDIPVPQPGSNDVLVQVKSAGVNNTDINTRIGWYSKGDNSAEDASWAGQPISFPRIQGSDVCGYIVDVGVNVPQSRIGDRVLVEPCLIEANGKSLSPPWYLGSECDGGFAEYTVVASRHAYSVNSPLTDSELASFPCSYSAAENLLVRSQVTAKDRVLVTGASGGVGSAAVQLAKARGAEVIAITSPSKLSSILDLGASTAISRDDNLLTALGKNSVDVVVDVVAGPHWPALLDVLKPRGRYATAGAIAGPHVSLDIRTLYLKDLTFFGCTSLDLSVFSNSIQSIETGQIRPLVAQTFPLEQIAQAQQLFLQKQFIGKIVLTID